jgi:hypothetical protein
VLIVGIAGVPGVEEHGEAVLSALAPWAGGHRLPNFSYSGSQYREAFDAGTLARLRRAVLTYDPDGVMAIGRALDV